MKNLKTVKKVGGDLGLKVGVGRRNITPERWELLTQTGMARLERTMGVIDELFVEALCFEAGGEVGFVTTGDLRTIEREWVFRIQEEVGKRVGCDGRRVLLSSTHDHCSSPAVWEDTAEAKAALLAANEKIVTGYVEACVEAWEKRVPAEIGFAAAELKEPVGENRGIRLSKGFRAQCWGSGTVLPPGQKFVGPAGPDSTEVRVVAVREVGKKGPFAVLTSYPSHTHLANLPYFSGEFPGTAKREIQRRVGKGVVALYANHEGGNIDVHCVHPQALGSMEEKVAWFKKSQEILGKRFADAVVPAVKKMRGFVRPKSLRHRYWTTGDAAAQADRAVPLTMLNTLGVGEVVFMSMPGEVFIEYFLRLKKKSPVKKLMLVGYNGTGGWYMPEPIGFELGGYETMRGPAVVGAEFPAVVPGVWGGRAAKEAGEELEGIMLKELRGMRGDQ